MFVLVFLRLRLCLRLFLPLALALEFALALAERSLFKSPDMIIMRFALSFWAILAIGHVNVEGQTMDNKAMSEILASVTDSLEGMAGFWQLTYNDRVMLVITDEPHDRMRIISPILVMEEVSPEEVEEAMTANFHSTLDVRYAISDDIMWAVFIHPLRALSEVQVRDALLQVYRASETFGGSYSSSELIFPGRSGKSRHLRKKM